MLQEYIQHIFTQSQMEKECLLIALLYMERVLFSALSSSSPTFYLTSLNWRAFISSALLVASKMWDDFSMVNGDYVSILRTHHLKSQSHSHSQGTASSVASPASVATTLRPFSAASCHQVDICRVNNLEAKFLALIGFNVCVTGEDYARVYFRLTVSASVK